MKKYLAIALAVMLVGALATGVLAGNVGRIMLFEKDAAWDVVPDGASGALKYVLKGPRFNFSFHGHGLEPGVEYSLIYYADQSNRFVNWGGNNPGGLLGTKTTNSKGDINFGGSVELDMDIPHPNDTNYPDGAKIWLVPSDCYDAGAKKVTTWSPGRFLFENELITYDDTGVDGP